MYLCTASVVPTLYIRVPLKCTEIDVYIRNNTYTYAYISTGDIRDALPHQIRRIKHFFRDVKLSDKILNHKYRDTMWRMSSKLGLISRGKTLSMPGIHQSICSLKARKQRAKILG